MHKTNKRILLIYPPDFRLYNKNLSTNVYPLSLGYLAGTIKSETDWDILVYNADFVPGNTMYLHKYRLSYLCGEGFNNYIKNLTDLSYPVWKEVQSKIHEFKPSIIGIYCCSANLHSVNNIAKIAKLYNRDCIVIVGGPHPSSVRAEMLVDPNVDISVIGEGEKTFVEILEAVQDNRPLSKIKGIIYKTGSKAIETSDRDCVTNLDSLSFPYKFAPQVLKDFKDYPKEAFQYIIATRGCSNNCLFCGSRYVFGRKIRYRSIENIIMELKLLTNMGVRSVQFIDDTFVSNKKYTAHICASIVANFKDLKWSCYARADAIDDQIVALMKKSGCIKIAIGVESGNNEILRKMRKNITLQTALNAAKIIRKHKIKLVTFFIVGFPGETEETLLDTLETMKKIDGQIVYNIFTPYPGTEGFNLCKQSGSIGKDYDPSLFNHQSPENCFCRSISKEKFRKMASQIEEYVEKHNAKISFKEHIQEVLSFDTLRKMAEYGLLESLKIFLEDIRPYVRNGKSD